MLIRDLNMQLMRKEYGSRVRKEYDVKSQLESKPWPKLYSLNSNLLITMLIYYRFLDNCQSF